MTAGSGGSFATLTHARLRVAQGDIGGAMRILRVILSVQPEHDEARALLAEIEDRVSIRHAEPEGPAADPVKSATAGDLSGRFRETLSNTGRNAPVEKLSRWIERARRNRGDRHV